MLGNSGEIHLSVISAFRLDEHELIADEVHHRLGKKCTIHARSAESLTFAANAGFDWIYARLLHRRRGSRTGGGEQIPIWPALRLPVNALDATGAETSAASRDGLKREIDGSGSAKNIRPAYDAGVPIMAGSESGFSLTPYGY